MTLSTVLVADDDPHVHEMLGLYFRREGIELVSARSGDEVHRLLEKHRPQAVVLDIMMPGKDGFEVCREIRAESDVPVLMLTAKGEEVDRILGLELGADDYITKPFSPRELIARLRAVLRRVRTEGDPGPAPAAGTASDSEREQAPRSVSLAGLEVDAVAREVHCRGEPVALTPKEFDLLYLLASNPRRAFSREELLERVWGFDFFGDMRTVDVHVKRLRKKLGSVGPRVIRTVWGVGYKFEGDPGADGS